MIYDRRTLSRCSVRLRLGKAAAIDAVVNRRVDPAVHLRGSSSRKGRAGRAVKTLHGRWVTAHISRKA
eukprot:6191350-Pleurochrysis_carterae.AAC.2